MGNFGNSTKILLKQHDKEYYIFLKKNDTTLPPIGSQIKILNKKGEETEWLNLLDGVSLPSLVSEIDDVEKIEIKNLNSGSIWSFKSTDTIRFDKESQLSEDDFDPNSVVEQLDNELEEKTLEELDKIETESKDRAPSSRESEPSLLTSDNDLEHVD